MQPLPPKHGVRWISAWIGVAAVSVFAYLPTVHNTFISDDFTMLPFVRTLSAHPGHILEMPSEIFRAVSYIYFRACLQVFGTVPEMFYLTGIALHAIVSLLVGRLVLALTRDKRAGWAAALFFAAYERHQEAVMWISAVNDLLLTLFCLLFLLFWERAASDPTRGWSYRMAIGTLLTAMFSKEAAVAMIPLAVLLMAFRERPPKEIAWKCLPPVLMLAAYVVLWLGEAQRNFFVTDGHYALGLHFVPVFLKSFARITSPLLLFMIPLTIVAYRRSSIEVTSRLLGSRSFLFFGLLIATTILPYAFLTYLDHIPSRNTYLPSVGLAALIGLAFASVYEESRTFRGRVCCSALLAAVVLGNVAYIRVKKQPQFEERAAPTRELIANLNSPVFQDIGTAPIHVCGFPLHVSIGRSAVQGFTRFGTGRVAFLESCNSSLHANALKWLPETATYVMQDDGPISSLLAPR